MSGSGTGTPAVPASISKTVAGRTDAPFLLERISDPAIEPVTLAEMIEHVRQFSSISQAGQDELSRLIVVGREWAEEYTGRALIDQTWRITINTRWPLIGDSVSGYTSIPGYYALGWKRWLDRGEILLHKSPIIEITSFVSADSSGVETAIDPATYALTEPKSKWPRIAPIGGITWTYNALKLEFRAGFIDMIGSPPAGVVPERFKQAIKLHAEAHYDRDEKMMEKLLEAAENLLKPECAELRLA